MAIDLLGGSIQTRPILPGIGATAPAAGPGATAAPGSTFARLVEAVDSSNAEANTAIAGMLDGSGDVHDAMIALQRADLTLQFTVQVRNKLVQAYQDIMRMPV